MIYFRENLRGKPGHWQGFPLLSIAGDTSTMMMNQGHPCEYKGPTYIRILAVSKPFI